MKVYKICRGIDVEEATVLVGKEPLIELHDPRTFTNDAAKLVDLFKLHIPSDTTKEFFKIYLALYPEYLPKNIKK